MAGSGSRPEVTGHLRLQWTNPSNILDLLLLVGGDMIDIALAQLSGSKWLTPVVLSFGWVAYAFVMVTSAFGKNRLLRLTDVPSMVINGHSGYSRTNSSWILGRMLRDYEAGYWVNKNLSTTFENIWILGRLVRSYNSGYWMDENVRSKLSHMLNEEGKPKAGLCISLFTATSDKPLPKNGNEIESGGVPATEPKCDLIWFLGYIVAMCQLGIAAIPWGLWGEWEIFVFTLGGTALAFLAGSLREWRRERWSCRRLDRKATYVLTRGNGAQHALVIFAEPGSLNLEDLASSTDATSTSWGTKLTAVLELVLWIALLISVDGIDSKTWFLIAIGGLGMLYTIMVSITPRRPESWGIKIDPVQGQSCIVSYKGMMALIDLELAHPGVGQAIRPVFFPGTMSPDEQTLWNKTTQYVEKMHPSRGHPKVNAKARSSSEILDQRIQDLGK